MLKGTAGKMTLQFRRSLCSSFSRNLEVSKANKCETKCIVVRFMTTLTKLQNVETHLWIPPTSMTTF